MDYISRIWHDLQFSLYSCGIFLGSYSLLSKENFWLLEWQFIQPESVSLLMWKDNGESLKGYSSTYRRIKWDEPSPAITIRNDAISSQRNVHPGRKLSNGEYSDARVLTPLELMTLSSLPKDWKLPEDTPE